MRWLGSLRDFPDLVQGMTLEILKIPLGQKIAYLTFIPDKCNLF